MTLRILAPTLGLLLLSTACVQDVGSGKTAATVDVPAVKPAPPAAAERVVAIDPARSGLHALGAKVTKTHPIEFDQWSGKLRADGDKVVGIEVTVQMSSLRADVEKLTTHLKSADFFAVDEYPTSSFVSTGIREQSGPDGATHEVSGDLTMHGVTKAISFPATISGTGGELQVSAEFVINRQDFGIAYPGMPDDLIQDNVVLTVELAGS